MFRNKIIRITIGMLLLTGAVAGVQEISLQNRVQAAETTKYCGVSEEEIVYYMKDHGYFVEKIVPYEECDVIITSQHPYQTIVRINKTGVVGYEDIR